MIPIDVMMTARRHWLPQTPVAILATALLCLAGGFVAPSTLSAGAILGMLPFVAALGLAAMGQHLVIQHRGIDISVAGQMSLAGVLVSALPPLDAGHVTVVPYVFLALVVGLAAGCLNGILVTLVRVPALIATLGTNALFQGAAVLISEGHAQQVPSSINSLASGRTLWVPNALLLLAVVMGAAIVVLRFTMAGRRFTATSVSPRAAFAMGVRTNLYAISAYVAAAFMYALGAILLAGYLVSPPVFSGTPYMLATIAAVVVGGNSVAGGGNSSIAATVVGAFFLTYLSQLVVSLGFATALQFLLQAAIVLSGAALPILLANVRVLRTH